MRWLIYRVYGMVKCIRTTYIRRRIESRLEWLGYETVDEVPHLHQKQNLQACTDPLTEQSYHATYLHKCYVCGCNLSSPNRWTKR